MLTTIELSRRQQSPSKGVAFNHVEGEFRTHPRAATIRINGHEKKNFAARVVCRRGAVSLDERTSRVNQRAGPSDTGCGGVVAAGNRASAAFGKRRGRPRATP